MAYTAFLGSKILTFLAPFVWRWPENYSQIRILICMTSLAALAEICIIKSLELAEVVDLAPVCSLHLTDLGSNLWLYNLW